MKQISYSVTLITPSGEQTIRVGEEEHIWDAARAQGLTLPAICHQGRCLTCAGRLEKDAAAEFDARDAGYYYPADREAGFILLCTSKPRSDLRIRTHQQHEMREFRKSKHLPAPYA